MRCVAYTESRDELSPPVNGSSWGPWQIDKQAHPWLNVYRVTHSWRYAARAARRVAWHPARNGQPGYFDFSPWHPDCGA
jgi:hypothetical protein